MNWISIKHIVRLSFDGSSTMDVVLSFIEEHPGGETPVWSLEAEREACKDNIDDLLEQQEYALDKPYTDVQVISTSISNDKEVLGSKVW